MIGWTKDYQQPPQQILCLLIWQSLNIWKLLLKRISESPQSYAATTAIDPS